MNLIKETVFQHLFERRFISAYQLASNNPDSFTSDQYKLIVALSRQYGDDGVSEGDQGTIVENALANIGVYDDADEG